MKAVLKDRVIAESDDIVEQGDYHCFPSAHVRLEWLEKAERRPPIILASQGFEW